MYLLICIYGVFREEKQIFSFVSTEESERKIDKAPFLQAFMPGNLTLWSDFEKSKRSCSNFSRFSCKDQTEDKNEKK